MATWIAGLVLVVWALGAVVLVRGLHARAWRIESADLDPAEQTFRLHRLLPVAVAATGGYALAGLTAVAYLSFVVDDSWRSVGIGVAGTLLCILPMVATVRVTRRALARVRDASIQTHGSRYVLLVSGVTAVVIAVGIVVGHAVLPAHGVMHLAGMLVVYLIVLVMMQVLIAPLLVVTLRAKQLPDETRRRLRRLAARMNVRVRDIRAVPGLRESVANAAQIGAVPGLRYIVVTDYLLERLDPDEVDAIVAHELGHVRRHHLTVKLGAVFGMWALLECLLVTVVLLVPDASPALLMIPVFIAFPLGMLAVQVLAGSRLERQADDVAAGAVGGQQLAAALETVGRVNGAAPEESRLWLLLTQHPGLDERLRRLRTRVPATMAR